jgi:NAD(P)-dependent dehydrogenase (short-subunit alcohol dehydrogenase family)
MDGFGGSYKALVLGASGGIGAAFVEALRADANCEAVLGLSRRDDGLEVTDEASVTAAAQRVAAELGQVELVIAATGALTIDGQGPEKTIKAIDPTAMARQFAVNAIGPALLLKHIVPLMPTDRRAVFAALSAKVGSIGDNKLGGWISYRSSKAALNQILRTASVEISRTHRQAVVVALHPGSVVTPLTQGFGKSTEKKTPEQSVADMLAVIDRLTPAESGSFRAYDDSGLPW